ncbi:hypothetical protein [Brevundimonas sp.]|uniref:hypothetical protein n=1 Tax=Brevundimonas sp. TaxID=1871086 RepID=UPI00289C6236|nr:hypothetical protein [Brevundimonas sp.]
MKPNWQIRELNVHFAQKTASVALFDGQISVHVHFAFDPAGDQRESEVQRRALAKAKELFLSASQASVQPIP